MCLHNCTPSVFNHLKDGEYSLALESLDWYLLWLIISKPIHINFKNKVFGWKTKKKKNNNTFKI